MLTHTSDQGHVPAGHRREVLSIFLAALVVAVLPVLIRPLDRGGEVENVAVSLATNHGFSSPYRGDTGPTAVVPPLFPVLLGLAFKVFGVETARAVLAVGLFDSGCLAVTVCAIFLLANIVFDRRIARWSAGLWLFFSVATALMPFYQCLPYSGHNAFALWETPLTTPLILSLVLTTIAAEKWERIARWAAFGVLAGIAALSSPATLALAPVLIGWSVARRRKANRPWRGAILAMLATLLLAVAPWIARNGAKFGQFVFIRSNFWLEVQLANNEMSQGFEGNDPHPNGDRDVDKIERERYATTGEMAYMADHRARTLRFVREHPLRFAKLTGLRIFYYWGGEPRSSRWGYFGSLLNLPYLASSLLAFWGLRIAAREHNRYWILFGGILLFYTLVYYLVSPSPEYRYPIEPLLLILACKAAHSFICRIRERLVEARGKSTLAGSYSLHRG